jgi:hypothetical protein
MWYVWGMNFLQKLFSLFNPSSADSIWDTEEGDKLIGESKAGDNEIKDMTPAESSNEGEEDVVSEDASADSQ